MPVLILAVRLLAVGAAGAVPCAGHGTGAGRSRLGRCATFCSRAPAARNGSSRRLNIQEGEAKVRANPGVPARAGRTENTRSAGDEGGKRRMPELSLWWSGFHGVRAGEGLDPAFAENVTRCIRIVVRIKVSSGVVRDVSKTGPSRSIRLI
ncbi:hypothetical protein ACFSQT_35725 [Mesorhizobium calcicola]|uniref:Secreted protein n=1 Tax=Mesorhizobium calcicola TaxID=1300310 RepID=A0ABW4WRM1_9HYPH